MYVDNKSVYLQIQIKHILKIMENGLRAYDRKFASTPRYVLN